jgi:hypothetical protein
MILHVPTVPPHPFVQNTVEERLVVAQARKKAEIAHVGCTRAAEVGRRMCLEPHCSPPLPVHTLAGQTST